MSRASGVVRMRDKVHLTEAVVCYILNHVGNINLEKENVMRTRIVSVVAAVAVSVLGFAGVASASVRPAPHPIKPVISVNISTTGVETTAAPVVTGEVLSLIGVGTGHWTVTSVHPAGPVERITLAGGPLAPNNVYDFHVVSVPLAG